MILIQDHNITRPYIVLQQDYDYKINQSGKNSESIMISSWVTSRWLEGVSCNASVFSNAINLLS